MDRRGAWEPLEIKELWVFVHTTSISLGREVYSFYQTSIYDSRKVMNHIKALMQTAVLCPRDLSMERV